MALNPGTRLGSYDVVAKIGAGGMGEVYRARDTKLRRDVALKILPDDFAHDPDRLARFQREAHVLASLNHPNIAQIYGFEDAGGTHALVMELVDGPTLADRIARGAIPLDEVLPIAKQIAEALEAAHEQGIIHRDLKPANVKVKDDGLVKVLDFGLAKALDPVGSSSDVANSPTITSPAMTQQGVILGTAAYMSPEQARGRPVDKRTDIWAYGCVLYEMLTGTRAFAGVEMSDVLASVLAREPDWHVLPENTPAHVRTILQRCLEKDSKRRLRDIGDARIELDSPRTTPAPATGSRLARRTWVGRAAIVAVVVGSVALAAWAWLRPHAPAPAEPVRVTVRLAPGTTVTRGPQFASSVALSPDGRLLVIAGKDANGQRLYRRPLDWLEPMPLAGTEGASSPFFSPDGAWIGFFATGPQAAAAVRS